MVIIQSETKYIISESDVCISILKERAKVIDFSVAYLETGFSYVSVAEHKFDVWAFLEPFDNNLWLMIVFTVIMVSILSLIHI